MTKIVSRSATNDPNVERLRQILKTVLLDGLGHHGGSGIVANLETNMDGLVNQTSTLFSSMLTTLEKATDTLYDTNLQLFQLESSFDTLSEDYNKLTQNIGYDEALDHAAGDLMDCLAAACWAAGGSNVTADGALVLDQQVSFTKADIKPMLRVAIISWISAKQLI